MLDCFNRNNYLFALVFVRIDLSADTVVNLIFQTKNSSKVGSQFKNRRVHSKPDTEWSIPLSVETRNLSLLNKLMTLRTPFFLC